MLINFFVRLGDDICCVKNSKDYLLHTKFIAMRTYDVTSGFFCLIHNVAISPLEFVQISMYMSVHLQGAFTPKEPLGKKFSTDEGWQHRPTRHG